ncbi:NAD(+) synthase [Pseudotabrizicola algicola]|uniref:NH(3)-dependent NAD(+) synthetase n=1 Tax=Pseudotabrizicola algicola TaxID=2709381 RepID=A0A6B3RU94_9RHOB|nr:NAD(+) synthase [Pseudotabrizicola algicola]NEX48786.1 NAD(+) synthase [Pseudotabrizicola algicola]
MPLHTQILDLSRQSAAGGLSPWFSARLQEQIADGRFLPEDRLAEICDRLVEQLSDYREQAAIHTAVLGMSGGVDSALTAALLKRAGWLVIGFTLPILQDPEETQRGFDACEALGLEHRHLDLSDAFEHMLTTCGGLDAVLMHGDDTAPRTRRGNLRARLRMMTLYDQAHRFGGLVASTDNFSELGAGFWTLHGDVGDLAPVQSLLKSWEVPWLARATGVPEQIWRALPTDGLGIGAGDEAQIGATYLEWDIILFALMDALRADPDLTARDLSSALDMKGDRHARDVLDAVLHRLATTWFKRMNPIRLDHPVTDRYGQLDAVDERLFRPAVVRGNEDLTRFPAEVMTQAQGLCQRLTARGLRLVTAESCTGGLLAGSLSAVSGSSSVLEGSFVTYRPSLKIAALGVSKSLIDEKTVYHPEVAQQMATGALQASPEADLALAITGVAGPGPDQGKPAGLVCIAAALRGQVAEVRECRFDGDPRSVIAAAIRTALAMGIAALDGSDGSA